MSWGSTGSICMRKVLEQSDCTHAAQSSDTDMCASCRGLFATHYHKLADAHADDPATSIRHMACHVADDGAGREQVAIAAQFTKPVGLAL